MEGKLQKSFFQNHSSSADFHGVTFYYSLIDSRLIRFVNLTTSHSVLSEKSSRRFLW